MSIARNIAATLAVLLITTMFTAANAADKSPDYARVVPLVATSKTIVGETISYPPGTAKITSAIVTLKPGESTGFHKHGVPTYGYIVSGAVTVDYGDHGKRTYKTGAAFMEAMGVWHDGTNDGQVPCRILVVFMGSDESANVIKK
jgi:quercetin dioxygenase-like cupin family protein